MDLEWNLRLVHTSIPRENHKVVFFNEDPSFFHFFWQSSRRAARCHKFLPATDRQKYTYLGVPQKYRQHLTPQIADPRIDVFWGGFSAGGPPSRILGVSKSDENLLFWLFQKLAAKYDPGIGDLGVQMLPIFLGPQHRSIFADLLPEEISGT